MQHVQRSILFGPGAPGDFNTLRQQEVSEESSVEEADDEPDDEADTLINLHDIPQRRRIILTDAAPSPPINTTATHNTSADDEESDEESDDDSPMDWKRSKTKQRIIKELKDQDSDIHLQIDNDLTKANYKRIHEVSSH